MKSYDEDICKYIHKIENDEKSIATVSNLQNNYHLIIISSKWTNLKESMGLTAPNTSRTLVAKYWTPL